MTCRGESATLPRLLIILDTPLKIHATVVSIDGNGIIFRGPPGSGKSDLALRLIGDGAFLVADDWCDLIIINNTVVASPPDEIAGLLEVRGLGVCRLEYVSTTPVALVVDLSSVDAIDRLPESASCTDWGPAIPCIKLAPFEASATDKVRMALRQATGDLEIIS